MMIAAPAPLFAPMLAPIFAPMLAPRLAPLLLEAALRALVAAAVLWTGLRLLRVHNVPAQKTAWGLVLAVALAMPLLMRIPLPAWAQLRLPALPLPHGTFASSVASSAAPSAGSGATFPIDAVAPSHFYAAPAPTSASAPEAASSPAPAAFHASAISMPRPAADSQFDPTDEPDFDPAAEFNPPLRVAQEKARVVSPNSAAPVSVSANSVLPASAAPAIGVPQSARPVSRQALLSAPRFASRLTLSPLQWLWSAYLVIGAALLFRLLIGLGSSLRLWLHARPVQMPAPLGHDPLIPVRASTRIASPVNFGSGIVLPAGFESWDEEKLRVVLAHESSHVRQRDFYLQLLAGLYAALLWFSPLGWWLKRKLSELGEAISDRAALEAAASPSDYAQLLLEFAALPRQPITGVAMAHAHNLSARIERLLNDATFRQSFAPRRRALAALLVAAAALLASTAMVRVHAAESPRAAAAANSAAGQDAAAAPQAMPAQAPPALSGQSHPDQDEQAPPPPQSAPVAPASQPSQPPQPDAAPAPDAAPPADVAPVAPSAPAAPAHQMILTVPDGGSMPMVLSAPYVMPPAMTLVAPMELDGLNDQVMKLSRLDGLVTLDMGGFDADAAALVGDPGTTPRFFGSWDGGYADDLDKARKLAHGHFFWFHQGDKSYIVDDPAIVSQLESMEAHRDDLRKQMRDLREQARGMGQQEREQARKQHEAMSNLPKPDLSEAVAQLDAAVASLKSAQGDTVSREQLAEVQRRLGEIQGKLMASEMKVNWNVNGDWSRWSDAMSKYGAQMSALGSQMSQAAKENHEKIRSIIDESIKNGKARPVE